jgi:hypothetical protein
MMTLDVLHFGAIALFRGLLESCAAPKCGDDAGGGLP